MREMILNHASLPACTESDRHKIPEWFEGVSEGMSQLIRRKIVDDSLRVDKLAMLTCWYDGYSFWDSLHDIKNNELKGQLMGWISRMRSPLLNGINDLLCDRFERCEHIELSKRDGDPLLLCAISNGVAISFPTNEIWRKDQIRVDFQELLPDGENFEQSHEVIDQLAHSNHVDAIHERHRKSLISGINSRNFWTHRQEIFPRLIFGPDVEENIRDQSTNFEVIFRKIEKLSQASQEWPVVKGPVPPWGMKVTPETESVRNTPRLLNARKFRSHSGDIEIFEWHARYGGSGRIHLRFTVESWEIEIGYIGPHLPLS